MTLGSVPTAALRYRTHIIPFTVAKVFHHVVGHGPTTWYIPISYPCPQKRSRCCYACGLTFSIWTDININKHCTFNGSILNTDSLIFSFPIYELKLF